MRNAIVTALCTLLLSVPASAQPIIRNHHASGNSAKADGGGNKWFGTTGIGVAGGRASGGGIVVTHGIGGGVADELPPDIRRPDNIRVSTGADACEADVEFPEVTVTDNRDRNPRVTVTLLTDPAEDIDPEGETVTDVPLGSYDVRIVAVDRYGNRSQVTYRLDVVDLRAPVFRPVPNPTPANEPREAASPLGTRVVVEYDCVDECDDDPSASRDPNQLRYQLGNTEVALFCEDEAGNEAREDIVIRIVDTTPPRLQRALPRVINAECENPEGATFDVPAAVWIDNGSSADDLVIRLIVDPDGANTVYEELPRQLRLRKGEHVLRYTATDEAGNTAVADLNVNINDNGVPEIEVVDAPDSGWLQPGQEVVIEVTDGCADPNAEMEVNIVPRPDDLVRDGNRFTMTFQDEGLYRLQIEVRDDDDNVGRDNSVRFGIDGADPFATLARPAQNGVASNDELSYPFFVRAERMALSAGGGEDADGVSSGIANVTVTLDPDGLNRVLADHDYEGEGVPSQGDRVVSGVGCEKQVRVVQGVNVRDGFCNRDVELDLRHVPVGVHRIVVTATDFAGNTGSTSGVFISSNLVDGIPRVIERLTEARDGAPGAVVQRVAQASGRLNQALDIADITDGDSDFDSPVFLGGSLRKVQEATTLLVQAIGVAQGETRAEIRDATALLLKLGWSDAQLLLADANARDRVADPRFLRNAFDTDVDRTGQALELLLENIENDAFNQGAANALLGFFHAKSARSGWMMDYHFEPNGLDGAAIDAEYERGRNIARAIVAELTRYLQLADAPAADVMRQIRDRLNAVVEIYDVLVEDGFRTFEDPDEGISDEQYVDALLDLRAVANFSQVAANQGAYVRAYQWPLTQIVRFFTQASIKNTVASRGGGRDRFPLHVLGLELVADGIELLDERRVQAAIELYGQDVDAHCLIFAVYHCGFLDDEGERDVDRAISEDEINDADCADRLFLPDEWEDQETRDRVPAECQYFPDGDADDFR